MFVVVSIAASQAIEWSDDDDEYNENEPFLESIDDGNETIYLDAEPDVEEMTMGGESSSKPRKKRGRKQFLTARLVAALDNAKVSDGMAVHILIAAIEALGHRVEEYAINRSTIHRLRQENRSREFEEIESGFSDNVMEIFP